MTNWPKRGTRRPWVYGHRGVRGEVPENTLWSFERSIAEGADGIELDVRLNHEGATVVFHDDSLERMTDGRDSRDLFGLSLRELTRVALNGGGAIPVLAEVLDWASGRDLFLNIELKPRHDDARRLTATVMQEILLGAGPRVISRVLLSSFSREIIAQAIEQQWPLPIALLIGPHPLALPPNMGSNRFGVHPHYKLTEPNQMAEFRKSGTFINVWTVNDRSVAVELDRLQVDGVITDEPRKIRDLFE